MTKAETRFIHTTGRNGIHKVIALGQYHGETVRAIAKCAPNDTPSVERRDSRWSAAGAEDPEAAQAFAEAQLTKKYDYLEFLAAEMDKPVQQFSAPRPTSTRSPRLRRPTRLTWPAC